MKTVAGGVVYAAFLRDGGSDTGITLADERTCSEEGDELAGEMMRCCTT